MGLTRFGVTVPAARLVLKGCNQQFHHGKVMSDRSIRLLFNKYILSVFYFPGTLPGRDVTVNKASPSIMEVDSTRAGKGASTTESGRHHRRSTAGWAHRRTPNSVLGGQ